MAENNKPAGQLSENGAVQEFLKLLTENRPDKGQDFSVMLWQLEGMGRQLDAALHELQEVKTQLYSPCRQCSRGQAPGNAGTPCGNQGPYCGRGKGSSGGL